ncbi:hypothetical protein [Massilia sp. CFBP9026]|uniref:hypothetical protein n=1 Tax=Massilia sp. CFBP9026 TaxID=3096536 RepID=UPI002A6A2CCD|nr:hypothetical protein [Massilia sp. CFBP9026]MDY0961742.1 hypothetical protein [Massilia sp. CFBP9026]
MIDISKLPAVRAQLERDIAARVEQKQDPKPQPVEYARAPLAGGGAAGAIR